jgi:hypothetical protein
MMDCGIIRPAQPSRASASQLPTPGRRGLQVTHRASWPVVVWAAGADLPPRLSRESVSGQPQARATRTRNPWHRAPETVSSHGRELSRLPASLPPQAVKRAEKKKARNQMRRSS